MNSKTANPIAESQAQKMLKSIKPAHQRIQPIASIVSRCKATQAFRVRGLGFGVHSNQGPRFQG